MARYTTTVRSPRSPADAFAFMADLRNFERWDPGVSGVTQVAGDGGGHGSVFDVVVRAGGRDLTLRYITTRCVEPTSVTVQARSSMLTSIDRIDVAADGDGSLVTYDAELRLNGVLAIFDLLLRRAFDRIGDRAAAGLERALDGARVRP
jgi:carbon monoxide dehydrogenase subunit G